MAKISISDVLNMSVAERILLVEDIWDSVAEFPEEVPLTDAQRDELERRLEAYHKNPKTGSPWNVVKSRLQKKQ